MASEYTASDIRKIAWKIYHCTVLRTARQIKLHVELQIELHVEGCSFALYTILTCKESLRLLRR